MKFINWSPEMKSASSHDFFFHTDIISWEPEGHYRYTICIKITTLRFSIKKTSSISPSSRCVFRSLCSDPFTFSSLHRDDFPPGSDDNNQKWITKKDGDHILHWISIFIVVGEVQAFPGCGRDARVWHVTHREKWIWQQSRARRA